MIRATESRMEIMMKAAIPRQIIRSVFLSEEITELFLRYNVTIKPNSKKERLKDAKIVQHNPSYKIIF